MQMVQTDKKKIRWSAWGRSFFAHCVKCLKINHLFVREKLGASIQSLVSGDSQETDVFILCPYSEADEKSYPLESLLSEYFFSMMLSRSRHQPIFLSYEQAKIYARFMGGRYLILQARLPECAVQTNGDKLSLRQGMLTRQHCRRVSLAWFKQKFDCAV